MLPIQRSSQVYLFLQVCLPFHSLNSVLLLFRQELFLNNQNSNSVVQTKSGSADHKFNFK